MKNTETKIVKFETTTAKAIADLSNYGKKMLIKKDFTELYASIETARLSAIAYYQAKESGAETEKVKAIENAHYNNLRNLLAIIGKVNGFTLKAGGNYEGSTLFIDSVAFAVKVKKINTSTAMASAKCTKKLLTEKVSKALAEKRYTDYETAKAELTAIETKIKALADESGNESRVQAFSSCGAYAKALLIRLSQIINGVATETAEQLRADQDRLNQVRKANRKTATKSKATAKAETKTATEKVA